jgi:hypothetical protein
MRDGSDAMVPGKWVIDLIPMRKFNQASFFFGL